MKKLIAAAIVAAVTLPAPAGVKVGGSEFVPKDLIFASADSTSQAGAEGTLPNDCKWTFLAETRIGRRENAQRCVRFYFKTSVVLTQSCPAKEATPVRRYAERITATDERCPDGSGRLNAPSADTKVMSSGTTVDGRRQEILRQADGTRVNLSYDEKTVVATVSFPDGTSDVLKLP